MWFKVTLHGNILLESEEEVDDYDGDPNDKIKQANDLELAKDDAITFALDNLDAFDLKDELEGTATLITGTEEDKPPAPIRDNEEIINFLDRGKYRYTGTGSSITVYLDPEEADSYGVQ